MDSKCSELTNLYNILISEKNEFFLLFNNINKLNISRARELIIDIKNTNDKIDYGYRFYKRFIKSSLETIDLIVINDLKISSICAIAKVQAEIKDSSFKDTFKLAVEAVNSFTDESNKSFALYDIIKSKSKAKDGVESALETFNLISIEEVKSDALCEIAKMQAEMGDKSFEDTFKSALEIANLISNEKSKSSTLCKIASAQVEVGGQSFKNTLELALETTNLLTAYYRASTLYEIVKIQIKAKDIKSAKETFNLITVDHRSKASALCEIAIAQAEIGDQSFKDMFVLAIKIANLISDGGKDAVLRNIVRSQIRANDIKSAIETCSLIDDSELESSSFGYIVKAQAEIKDIKSAVEICNLIDDAVEKSSALCAIAIAQFEIGDKVFKDTFKNALDIANVISNKMSQLSSLCEIAIAQAKTGNVESAIETIKPIDDGEMKSSVLCKIAIIQAKKFDKSFKDTLKLSLQIANFIDSNISKSITLANIIETQMEIALILKK